MPRQCCKKLNYCYWLHNFSTPIPGFKAIRSTLTWGPHSTLVNGLLTWHRPVFCYRIQDCQLRTQFLSDIVSIDLLSDNHLIKETSLKYLMAPHSFPLQEKKRGQREAWTMLAMGQGKAKQRFFFQNISISKPNEDCFWATITFEKVVFYHWKFRFLYNNVLKEYVSFNKCLGKHLWLVRDKYQFISISRNFSRCE